jgi:predicted RecA/RadA family phage recombinase
MNNYIGPGNAVTVVMPYAVNSGSGVLKGTLFGVAQNTYASGATGVLATEGIFTALVKASGTGEAWAAGDPLYWNDTNKNLVKASGTGNTAAPIGWSLETVGTAVTTAGEVLLAK